MSNTTRAEKLKAAIDLADVISEDLTDEVRFPDVVKQMNLNAALDNAQQLLETLQDIKNGKEGGAING